MTIRDSFHPDVGGLGRKVEKPKAEAPEWVPTATKGVERNVKTGQLRTCIPENELVNIIPIPLTYELFRGSV